MKDPEDQTHGFTGIALLDPRREGAGFGPRVGPVKPGTMPPIWSFRMEEVCPGGFTTGHANEKEHYSRGGSFGGWMGPN